MVHEASCLGVGRGGDDACREGSSCRNGTRPSPSEKAFVSKLKMKLKKRGKGEDWGPVRRIGNPCSSVLVESYLTFESEEH